MRGRWVRLYTLEQRTGLSYTVPLAAFGLLRYVYIVKDGKGDPTAVLLKDGQIIAVGVVWAAISGFVVYGKNINDKSRSA